MLEKRIDARRVHDRYREGLLLALPKAERLSPAFAQELFNWRDTRTDFSAFVREVMPQAEGRRAGL